MESTLLTLSLLGAPIDKTTFNNPLIVTETAQVQIVEPPKPITWESNPAQCNQTTQWIAKEEPFYCIDKPKPRQSSFSREKSTQPNQSTQSGNTYSYGYCTAYVKNQLSWVPNGWGDARNWASNARNSGFTVSSTPIVGSIATKSNHVALVIAVNGDQITISEANYQGWNVVSSRTIGTTGWQFIY